MYTEKSYLRGTGHRRYDQDFGPAHYHRRVKQFQCCTCILILCAVSILLIVMVEYAIEKQEIGNDDNSSSLTSSLPPTNLLRLGLGAWDGKQHNVTTDEIESALKWGSAQLKKKIN